MKKLLSKASWLAIAATVWLPLAGPGTAAAATTLNFLTAEPPDVYAAAIAAFEKQNPDIKVQYERVPFDSMNAQIEARLGTKDPSIDVYAVDSPRVPAMAQRGYLLKFEDYRQQIDAITNPAARNALLYQKEYWALPLWTSTQLLFYNKDLLAKAGIQPPSAAEKDRPTWDKVLDMAKKAQAAGAKWGLILEQIDRYYQLQSLFESSGAGPGLTGDDMLTPNLTSEKWIATAQWYADLFANGISPRGVSSEQVADLFINGQVVFYVGGPWNFARFNAKQGLNYGIAGNPYFADGKPATPTDSWALGISPFTDQMDAAKKFADFISLNPEGSYLTVANLPIPPVNLKAYVTYIDKIEKNTGAIGPTAKEVMTYELADASVSRPRSVGYVAFEEIMNRAFSDIRNGADVKATLQQAEAQLKSALSRL